MQLCVSFVDLYDVALLLALLQELFLLGQLFIVWKNQFGALEKIYALLSETFGTGQRSDALENEINVFDIEL